MCLISLFIGDVIHRSTHYIDDYDETLFIYSENEICNSGISDHNFYAVCRVSFLKCICII